MTENKTAPKGTAMLRNRNELAMDGVIDVLAFDETSVTLSTALGLVNIDGEELHVKKMDVESGQFSLEGKINGLYYVDDRPTHRKGLFGKRK